MSNPFVSQVGGVLSADIAVPEHERELRFYSRVLSTGTNPLWRKDLMNNQGMPVIGLGKHSAEYAELPLQWMPHIQVADVASSVEKAITMDGRVVMQHKAKKGPSQWAVLLDPNGAAFGVVPVVSPEAIPVPENGGVRAGHIAWLDLTVPDAQATADFYRHVVGWEVEAVGMKDDGERYADFNMLGSKGNAMAGVCHARGLNQGVPPVWMIYLPVDDLAESIRLVKEEGGTIINERRKTNGEYAYVVVKDPVGVYVALGPG